MPAAAPVVILVYLLLVIGSGAYVATREEGRGLFRSDAVKIVTVALFAALGVLPTEVLDILWMTLLRDYVDVTANLFLVVAGAVVAGMVALQAFALSRLYRARPVLLAAVCVGVRCHLRLVALPDLQPARRHRPVRRGRCHRRWDRHGAFC